MGARQRSGILGELGRRKSISGPAENIGLQDSQQYTQKRANVTTRLSTCKLYYLGMPDIFIHSIHRSIDHHDNHQRVIEPTNITIQHNNLSRRTSYWNDGTGCFHYHTNVSGGFLFLTKNIEAHFVRFGNQQLQFT